MLHIVNGDVFATKLAASGIAGDVLVWRESLYEGPVGEDLTVSPLLGERAAYMQRRLGVPSEMFIAGTWRQERELAALADTSVPIVLWFERDLYDQLMLAYLLSRLQRAGVEHDRLFMVCMDAFPGVEPFFGLGQLTPEQVASLHGTWTAVAAEQLQLGSRVWAAYVSSDPAALECLLTEDLSPLSFMTRSLQTHLKRYPSLHNGLSGLQQLVLELLAEQGRQAELLPLFRAVCERTADFGLGDLQFWALIDELRLCSVPLIAVHGGDWLPRFGEAPSPDFSAWRVELLEAGTRVLHGGLDHIQLNGIDEYIGGVRLRGNGPVWRWNPAAMRLSQA